MTQRFINADGLVAGVGNVQGYNMFAYCENSPVNKVDPSGRKPGDLFDTMDEAARDFAMIYAQLGYDNRSEYGSFIYSTTVTETCYGLKKNKNWYLNFSLSRGLYFDYIITFSRYAYKVKVKKYSYVKPNKGSEASTYIPENGSWFFGLGSKNKVAEIYNHTWIPKHYNDRFSPGDVRDQIAYLTTPSGTIRKCDPNNLSTESDGAITIYWDTPRDLNWGT